jgi:Leucine-rich repeat (LRR) protein
MTTNNSLLYWHISINPGPASITEVDEYDGSEDLAIVCTQLNTHTPAQQKKIVSAWCQFFSKQQHPIRRLWLHSRLPQNLFDSICFQSNLQALYIKWSGVKNISSISGLKSIQHLYFGNSSVEDITPFSELISLKDLSIECFYKNTDYSSIQNIKNLNKLCIAGNPWSSTKKVIINSLLPISNLVELTELRLDFVKVLDGSYDALSNLKNLRHLDLPHDMVTSEAKTLLAKLPLLQSGNVLSKNNV